MASIFLPTTGTLKPVNTPAAELATSPAIPIGVLDWSTHRSPRDYPSPLHLAPPSDSLRRHRTWMRSSFWVPDRVTFADSLGRGAKGVRVWKIKTSLRNVSGPRNGIIVMYSGLPRPDKAVEVLRAKCISLVMAMASTFRGGSGVLKCISRSAGGLSSSPKTLDSDAARKNRAPGRNPAPGAADKYGGQRCVVQWLATAFHWEREEEKILSEDSI
ncbi:hypothetical protein B0H10DRAFT_1955361 [Mycena sp. CBHHK59/15]|nr:hypothetical protein B0H10DRAFT_1955361 [Mycena sp. CBHHK59/15]